MTCGPSSYSIREEGRLNGLSAEEICLLFMPRIRSRAQRMLDRAGPRPALGFEDLVANGVLGLLQALDRYEVARETCFESYAHRRIGGQMRDALDRAEGTTRAQRQAVRRHARAEASLAFRTGGSPSHTELASEMGLSWDEYWAERELCNRGMSVSIDESEMEIAVEPQASKVVLAKETRIGLRRAIASLPDRLRTALILYYSRGCSLAECGAVLEVSASRVSQMLSEARERLRLALRRADLELNLDILEGAA